MPDISHKFEQVYPDTPVYRCTECGTLPMVMRINDPDRVFPDYVTLCPKCRIMGLTALSAEQAAKQWNRTLHTYTWTHNLPIFTGWYWLRRAGQEPIVAHVLVNGGNNAAVMLLGDDGVREQVYESSEIEWSDRPITTPLERPLNRQEVGSHAEQA